MQAHTQVHVHMHTLVRTHTHTQAAAGLDALGNMDDDAFEQLVATTAQGKAAVLPDGTPTHIRTHITIPILMHACVSV